MPRIKKKEAGRVPKNCGPRTPAKYAGRMMKRTYLKRRTRSYEEQEQGSGYAAGQVEHTTEWAADEMTAGVPVAITRQLAQPKLQKRKQPQPEPEPDVPGDDFAFSEQELIPDTGDTAHPFEIKRQPNPPRTKPADVIRPKGCPAPDLPELPQEPSAACPKHAVSLTLKKRSTAGQLKKRTANNAHNTVVTSPTEAITQRKNTDSSFTRKKLMQRMMNGARQFKTAEVRQYPTVGFQNARASRKGQRPSAAFPRAKKTNARKLRSAGTTKPHSAIQSGHGQREAATPTLSGYPKSRVLPVGTAKQAAQQNMKRQILANTKKAAKSAATITKRAVQAAAKAVTHLVSLLVSVVGGRTRAAERTKKSGGPFRDRRSFHIPRIQLDRNSPFM